MPDDMELLYGRIALKRGMITDYQLQVATGLQRQESSSGAGRRPLGELLLERGFITEAQHEKVVRLQKYSILRAEEKSYGRLAVSKGFVSQAIVDQSLAQQKADYQQGKVRRIHAILMEWGCLSLQHHDLLQKTVEGMGDLAPPAFREMDTSLHDAVSYPPPGRTAQERQREVRPASSLAARLNMDRIPIAATIAVLVLLGGIIFAAVWMIRENLRRGREPIEPRQAHENGSGETRPAASSGGAPSDETLPQDEGTDERADHEHERQGDVFEFCSIKASLRVVSSYNAHRLDSFPAGESWSAPSGHVFVVVETEIRDLKPAAREELRLSQRIQEAIEKFAPSELNEELYLIDPQWLQLVTPDKQRHWGKYFSVRGFGPSGSNVFVTFLLYWPISERSFGHLLYAEQEGWVGSIRASPEVEATAPPRVEFAFLVKERLAKELRLTAFGRPSLSLEALAGHESGD